MSDTSQSDTSVEMEERVVKQVMESRDRIHQELSKAIVGQRDVIEQVLISLFAGGHCLLTGAPGLAKTLLVRSVAAIFHLKFQRIQFTPDLMPADIIGTQMVQEHDEQVQPASSSSSLDPMFTHVTARRRDQPRHASEDPVGPAGSHGGEPRSRSAGEGHALDQPFMVLATQNPIEMEGTYPLPEAQLDRFMFNVIIEYRPEDDERSRS